MKTTTIVTEIRQTLKDCADEKARKSSDHFYKEGERALVYGVRMGEVGTIGKEFYKQIKDYPKQDIFEICEELWKSKYLEEAVIACRFTEALHKKYEPSDIKTFERWIKNYVNNWADCDTFCNHTVGTFVMMYPDYIQELKKWTKSSNRWAKRASAVSLIIPARKGLFLKDILEIADSLLLDDDHMVQKGYGWMLKAASMSETFVKGNQETKDEHLKAVFNFVMKHKSVMPRTALRYAIEKMPQDLKAKAMKK
ncbi:MAG: DNA alkylation repair protein [Bacteroidales bacterium]|jgi:3-methyladenine DNA glycosylase AlkD|nr:DNA alkylation repair protein [Bacteroidales bacterium]